MNPLQKQKKEGEAKGRGENTAIEQQSFQMSKSLDFCGCFEKKERDFTKRSQIYLWLSKKLSHWLAELQENPSIVIQSSSISSHTLFTNTTRERELEITLNIRSDNV